MAQSLLHGMLHVEIYEVKPVLRCGPLFFNLLEEDRELYATIDIEGAIVGMTRVLRHQRSNPKWNQKFNIYSAHMASNIGFSLKAMKPVGEEVIGRAYLPVEQLLGGDEVESWLPLLDENHKPILGGLEIHVKVQFIDVTRDVNWDQGIQTPDFSGVPSTYFSQKNGCMVTLYQDAHVDESFAPTIPLSEGKFYEQHRCWEDIFDAISSAKHLIYIVGWSVYTKITLVRDPKRPKPGGDMTLGELLKKKAQEGVRVLMLVWDDRTSLLLKDGLMKTHCEDTEACFSGSEVHCVLCPRNPYHGWSIEQDLEVASFFTHHQKTVVVDSDVSNGSTDERRRIMSFVGGIDLCDGRYDTQSHSLFRTLNTIHHDDFHQPNFPDASINKGGPREPWHDIHSRLEGPVAWDVLTNFEQRWRKQGGNDDLLLDLNKMDDIFIPPSPVTSPEDHETWNVQVFRSIDGGSAFGFPDNPEAAAKEGLVSKMDNVIDMSIHDAYINAIRRAKRFIYIENQYFLGSSFAWKKNNYFPVQDVGALHLIPKELSLKIVSKIEKGESFHVYIVVPMWPEGYPESLSVQAILYWQRETMQMMYTDIAQALSAKGIEANPRDYLSFFCLGNREVKNSGEYEPSEQPNPDTDYSRAQRARRFMIYVHAKLMIVDDEYIILGSANLNQRSMDGTRDTEITMGAYQPYHLNSEDEPARGQIHGFRMSLWYEHLGMLDDVFLRPESLECAKKMTQIAQDNWEMYTSDTLERDLPSHLLNYPVKVTQNGEVEELPGFVYFPDTTGRVLGTRSMLPPIITT